MKKRVSIIIPTFDEAGGIESFLDKNLLPVVKRIEKKYDVEIIVVDDGSIDRTVEIVKSTKLFHLKNVSSKLIAFSKNFGKEIALSAGISYATGEAIVMIDGDNQHPAETIEKMLEHWEKGSKIVTAVRPHNEGSHRLGSSLFYKLMHLFGSNIVEGALDLRLIDREVANHFKKFTEHNRITRGLIDWLGYPQDYIKVKINNRSSGKGTYDKKKLRKLATDSFVSMTATPLIILGRIGLFITIFSFFLGLFILVQQYILGDPMHLDWSGTVAMCVFIAFLVGLVLISQSITSLYISQIHTEAKNRPLYLIDIKKSKGIDV